MHSFFYLSGVKQVKQFGIVLLNQVVVSNECRVIAWLRNDYCITFCSRSPSSNPDWARCVVFLGKSLMIVL